MMHLGVLTALMNIQADKVLSRLLIVFWDLAKVAFKFVYFKLTPTLEEITSFTELPFAWGNPILSIIMPHHRFLYALGLRSNRNFGTGRAMSGILRSSSVIKRHGRAFAP